MKYDQVITKDEMGDFSKMFHFLSKLIGVLVRFFALGNSTRNSQLKEGDS